METYRNYTIQSCEWKPGKIEFFQEGEVTYVVDSVEEAKQEIDQKEKEWEEYQLRRERHMIETDDYHIGI